MHRFVSAHFFFVSADTEIGRCSILVQTLFDGVRQLVGARCRPYSATNAAHSADYVTGVLSLHQRADALCVAVASADEAHILHDVVVVDFDVNQPGTSPLGHVVKFFHVFCVVFDEKKSVGYDSRNAKFRSDFGAANV